MAQTGKTFKRLEKELNTVYILTLSDIIDIPTYELKPYSPEFSYIFIDLSKFSDDEIKGSAKLKLGFIILKHIYDPPQKLIKILDAHVALIKEIWGKENRDLFLEPVLRYLFITEVSHIEMKNLFAKYISKEGGDFVMSTAEKLMKEGEKKEKLEIAKKMVKKGYDSNEIKEVTGLSVKQIQDLKKNSK